jgi:hypothetical protein
VALFAAVFFTAAFFVALAGAKFLAALGAVLSAMTPLAFAAAFCRRHRAFVAAIILFIPSGLICRFGFGASAAGSVGSDAPFSFAQRAFCAAAIRLRDAAKNFFRGGASRSTSPRLSMVETSAADPGDIFENRRSRGIVLSDPTGALAHMLCWAIRARRNGCRYHFLCDAGASPNAPAQGNRINESNNSRP